MERVARLEIGQWWADRSTNELGRAGKAVRVEPKAMEVLMALAARAGQVVGREELLAAVWPGVIVGDEALTQSIIKLRRALGDNPRAPTYIETISKRGYRLIAPVRQAGDAPPARRRMPSRALAAGALVALVAAAGYVAHLVARRGRAGLSGARNRQRPDDRSLASARPAPDRRVASGAGQRSQSTLSGFRQRSARIRNPAHQHSPDRHRVEPAAVVGALRAALP